MERSRGYRGASNYSSNYSNRSADLQQHRGHRGGSSQSSHKDWSHPQKSYDQNYSSNHGIKRRHEHSSERHSSFNQYPNHEESSRKYSKADGGTFEGRGDERRSNHQYSQHRSQYENHSSSIGGRGRYDNRHRGGSYESNGGLNNHGMSSYHHQSDRRFDESRRSSGDRRGYQRDTRHTESSSFHHRGSGHLSNRGRGRGGRRGNSPNKHSQIKRPENDASSDLSDEEELRDRTSDVSMASAEETKQPKGNQDAKPQNVANQSESDKSPRDDPEQKEKTEVTETTEKKTDEVDNDSQKVEAKEDSNFVDLKESKEMKEEKKKSEAVERSSRKTASKDFHNHFIQLQCPHCRQRSVTFREYIQHLSSSRHNIALQRISMQHRMSLAKLRNRQRKEQLQIEAQSSRSTNKSAMNFCAICKLFHSESRPNHETTELHKIIKNFLMPYCPICRTNFKSRILYEKHIATLTHIKHKDQMEKAYERRRREERKHENTDRADELVLDLDSFMTLDVVGSVDGDGENGPALEENPIGEECVKKVEVYFCELCQRYLGRLENLDRVLELHCRSSAHHRAFQERQNNSKPNENLEAGLGDSLTEQKESDLKRSESQEKLWIETEKDIGLLGDLDDQLNEDDPIVEEEQDEDEDNQSIEENKTSETDA